MSRPWYQALRCAVREAVRFRRSIIDRLWSSTEVPIWVAVGGEHVSRHSWCAAVRSVEGELSDRLGNYWLLALGMLFVLTVVLMPTGLFGRILMPPVPKRLRGES